MTPAAGPRISASAPYPRATLTGTLAATGRPSLDRELVAEDHPPLAGTGFGKRSIKA